MKSLFFRLIRLIWGLFLFALGVVFTINAHIGYAPWEVFHVGIAKTMGISIGFAVIIVGIAIVLLTILLGEKFGLGTIINMVLIGVFLDMILASQLIPVADKFELGLFMLVIGLFIISFASYFYIGAGLGAGPRDSLMVALTRKTSLPIGICRGGLEVLVVLIGWQMGGMLGIGTVLAAVLVGFCIQITFRLLRFDATQVKHETLIQSYHALFNSKRGSQSAEHEVTESE